MAEQHDKILAALGVNVDTLKKLNELTPEQLKEFKLDEYVAPITTTFETKFLNDNSFLKKLSADKLPPEILKTIESNQYGRFMTEMKEVAEKELGLKIDGFTEDENKSLKKFFRKANQEYVATKAGDKTTLTDLQKQLATALQEKETVENSTQKKINDAISLEKGKYGSSIEKLVVKSYLTSLRDLGYELKANPEYIVDAVANKLKTSFSLNLNDDFSIDLKQKDNPQLDVLDGGGKKKTFNDALIETLTSDKMITKLEEGKDAQGKPVVTVKVEGDGKSSVIPEYIAANINKNIEAEKAMATK